MTICLLKFSDWIYAPKFLVVIMSTLIGWGLNFLWEYFWAMDKSKIPFISHLKSAKKNVNDIYMGTWGGLLGSILAVLTFYYLIK